MKKSTVKTSPVSSSAMQYQATAYTLHDAGMPNNGGKTASGKIVRQGRTIAADTSSLPLGTVVKITCPGYPSVNGIYTVEDTGGAIQGNILDIYFSNQSEAISFGRQTVYVSILN